MTGDRLKYEIKRRGYTIRRLAELLGAAPQNVSRKLATDDIPTSMLEAAAAMMGVTPASIYGGADATTAVSGDIITADHNSTAFKGTNSPSDPELLQATVNHLRDIIVRQDKTIADLNRRIDQLIELAKQKE